MPSVAPVGFDVPGLHESMPATKEISFADSGAEFFEQLLDIVNPLQHIPGVSSVYRALTGDEISTPARLIGGALFGGPVGMASAAGNLALESATGNDIAGHVLSLIDDLGGSPEQISAVPAATVTSAANTAVASEAPASDASDIVWNGPRILPSLAQIAREREVNVSEVSLLAPKAAPIKADGGLIKPKAASADARNLPTPPAWLEAAITDAKSVQNATQLGENAGKVEAQPWITEAMLDALGKYEALALERNK